jgi:hypothetical protein
MNPSDPGPTKTKELFPGAEEFVQMAEADGVSEARRWYALREGQLLRTARRYLQALRIGRATTTPFPEAQEYFKREYGATHISPGLLKLVNDGIKAFPARDRTGYAHDLCHMSRSPLCKGPEYLAAGCPSAAG